MRSQLVVCIKFRCGATSHWWLVVCREKTRPPSIRYNSGTILHKNVCQYFLYVLDYDTIWHQVISINFFMFYKYLKLSGLGEVVRCLAELAAEVLDIRSTLFSLLPL